MLKAKNIIIIFIVNYLVILLVCCFLEFILIGSKAQEIQIMMSTAADMALEQVQATDDFFITGKGYIMDGDKLATNVSPYQMNVLGTNGKYKKVNIFEAVTGKSTLSEIYSSIYSPNKIGDYIRENPNVLAVDFTAGWVDNGPIADGVPNKVNWFKIPVLAHLGDTINQEEAKKIYNMDGTLVSNTRIISEIWDMYDLKGSRKSTSLNDVATEYYLTPINVGITYINEDLLQAFFMNNLELLMRSKYTQRDNYNLNKEENGYGVLKTAFYPELVDTTTLSSQNPINNGSFTLLRGERMGSTDMSIEMFKGITPKIEYVVIDMYDNKYNDILQLIFGSKTTNIGVDTDFKGKEITGKLLKDMNQSSIDLMKNVTGEYSDAFEHKPIVVAKVTFYADFIVPYSTMSLREMRGRVENGDIGGRTLFNPFAYSQVNIENVEAIDENYVDIAAETLFENYGEYAGKLYKGANNLGSNGSAVMYTTYFAVTP